ncbi:MAG: tyrosine-protein phosphatase [Clostridia bacterium]|nr:tyrosine-protein phosphatase [Clostridia bacterium]
MYTPTDNLYNFRDLGGLRRKNGGSTLYGAFARSNIIQNITPEQTKSLKQKGFRTIIDLRTPEELIKHPHALANHPDFKYINKKCDNWWRSEFFTVEESAMYYIMLLLLKDNIRGVLTALADAEGGTIFNCFAGKDRTGVTAALLLLIADVEDRDIIDDYAKTYTARWGDTPLEELLPTQRLIPLPENMELFLAMFRARWRNVEEYCHSIDLPREKLLTLRRKLTGSAD